MKIPKNNPFNSFIFAPKQNTSNALGKTNDEL